MVNAGHRGLLACAAPLRPSVRAPTSVLMGSVGKQEPAEKDALTRQSAPAPISVLMVSVAQRGQLESDALTRQSAQAPISV